MADKLLSCYCADTGCRGILGPRARSDPCSLPRWIDRRGQGHEEGGEEEEDRKEKLISGRGQEGGREAGRQTDRRTATTDCREEEEEEKEEDSLGRSISRWEKKEP